jgi:hypothetical protein
MQHRDDSRPADRTQGQGPGDIAARMTLGADQPTGKGIMTRLFENGTVAR